MKKTKRKSSKKQRKIKIKVLNNSNFIQVLGVVLKLIKIILKCFLPEEGMT